MKYLSVAQVAEIIEVTEKSVRNYINNQELKAYKLGTSWKIKEDDLNAFIESKSNTYKGENK